VGPRAGLDGRKNLVPIGIRSRTVQPVAQSTELPGTLTTHYTPINCMSTCRTMKTTIINVASKNKSHYVAKKKQTFVSDFYV